MAEELTVVWCGSMRDVYLCVREPSFEAVSPDRRLTRRPADRQVVASILPTEQDEAMTTKQIQERSGASYGVVAQALYRLRKVGGLGWYDLPSTGLGQRPRAYWRKVAA